MGWMPGGLELSIWQSLWVQADGVDKGEATSLAAASFDFNFGYVLTVVLACLFLTLGTLTLPEQGLAMSLLSLQVSWWACIRAISACGRSR